MPHQPISCKDDLNKSVWKNIHFGRLVVWCGVNQIIIHFYATSNLPICPFVYSSFSSNHPGVKQQRRPLPSLLYLSFFYGLISEWFCDWLIGRTASSTTTRWPSTRQSASAGKAGSNSTVQARSQTVQREKSNRTKTGGSYSTDEEILNRCNKLKFGVLNMSVR